jgi:hypothetical protein
MHIFELSERSTGEILTQPCNVTALFEDDWWDLPHHKALEIKEIREF